MSSIPSIEEMKELEKSKIEKLISFLSFKLKHYGSPDGIDLNIKDIPSFYLGVLDRNLIEVIDAFNKEKWVILKTPYLIRILQKHKYYVEDKEEFPTHWRTKDRFLYAYS